MLTPQVQTPPAAAKPSEPAPAKKIKRWIIVSQCPNCMATLYLEKAGPLECSCGQEVLVSETEGLIPDGWVFG